VEVYVAISECFLATSFRSPPEALGDQPVNLSAPDKGSKAIGARGFSLDNSDVCRSGLEVSLNYEIC